MPAKTKPLRFIEFGNRLRQSREKKGLTVEQLAKACHMNPRSLHAWEAGRTPAQLAFYEVARRLGVTSHWLFFGFDRKSPLQRPKARLAKA